MSVRTPNSLNGAYDGLLKRAAAELEILYRRRRRVPCHHVSDAQWAILLELYVAEGSGNRVPTTALIRTAGAPKTTLLRLIDDLVERGLVQRDRTGPDARVTFIRPTGAARSIVDDVLIDHEKDAA